MDSDEATIRLYLPANAVSESWGKVRIASRGDSIRTSGVLKDTNKERNNSFVRVKQQANYV